MLPRGKLLALIAIVVAASMVAGTGAFSSVSADRTAKVQVTGDANAYLGLKAIKKNDNQYAKQDDKGRLGIKLDGLKSNAQGLNPDAKTSFDKVFKITNNGKNPVNIQIKTNKHKNRITYYASKDGKLLKKFENGNKVQLGTGKSITVGVEISTKGKFQDSNLNHKVTINAVKKGGAANDVTKDSGDDEEKQKAVIRGPVGL